jgi:hypothetical protein
LRGGKGGAKLPYIPTGLSHGIRVGVVRLGIPQVGTAKTLKGHVVGFVAPKERASKGKLQRESVVSENLGDQNKNPQDHLGHAGFYFGFTFIPAGIVFLLAHFFNFAWRNHVKAKHYKRPGACDYYQHTLRNSQSSQDYLSIEGYFWWLIRQFLDINGE